MAGSTSAVAAPTAAPSRGVRWALTLCIAIALVVNWLPYWDAQAQAYLSDTITSNAILFGVVRALNAIVSVVQSAQVGVGVASLGIGEIFDPVNDLIERFSGLLLITLTALGIQQVILLFTTSLAVKAVVSLLGLALIWRLWSAPNLAGWFGLALVLVLLRFLLNVEVALVWLFDWAYFNATGEQALSVLTAATAVLQNLKDAVASVDIGRLIFGPDSALLEREEIGSQIATSVVTLIVGMLFKSILIPLGTLWLGYQSAKFALRRTLQ
ncbi:MAG: hypothetical protein ACI9K8_001727 [Reinekea sp.]|jgi:hypothetical protein